MPIEMMNNSADNFNLTTNNLTEYRIGLILKYVIYCYQQLLTDNKKYDYAERGKIPKEEYLRNGLVNDYLQKSYNKTYFKQNISDNPSAEITFHPEETMTYIDSEKNKRTDKIDIAVWENNLQSIWSNKTDNEIRFAIECKRINKHTDYSEYKKDIDKFITRKHETFRLPFEGQIAFLEKTEINHASVKDEINKLLNADNHNLVAELAFKKLEENIDYSYISKHTRNYQPVELFSIFHLFLDYSRIVISN
jgi:hypothetical protein